MVNGIVVHVDASENNNNAETRGRTVCGFNLAFCKYCAAIIGIIAFVFLITALIVDTLYQLEEMGVKVEYGWNEARMSGTMSGGIKYDNTFPHEMVYRCRAWLGLVGISALAAIAAISGCVCVSMCDYISCIQLRTKVLAILFEVSSFFVFLASIAVISYDRPAGLDIGPSPSIGFIAAFLMGIPGFLFCIR